MPTALIDDVLDLILQTCSIPSLAVVSCVSFHTRELALPHLLRRVYFDRNPQQILTFLNFILDNAHDSDLRIISEPGRHVLELDLDSLALKSYVLNEKGEYDLAEKEGYPIPTWAPTVAKALRLMPNLRSFTLRDQTEEIVTYSPEFVPTVLSLPQLMSLILWDIGPKTSLYLGKAMDSLKGATKLQTLKLAPMEEMEVVAHEGVGQFLSHYSMHLTELCFFNLDLRTFLQDDGHRPDNSRVTFPAVGKLLIGACKLALEGLATAFPALHTLHLDFSKFLHPYSTGPRQNHVSFPNLISITGRYRDIYAILNSSACRDHVRRAVITCGWDDDDDIATSAYAVPKAAPHLKSLHFSQSNVKPLAWWQGLGATLPELTYLDISFFIMKGLDLICNHIPSAISQIPLEYVTLLIRGPLVDDREVQTTVPEEAIALSYAKGIPTLKYIDVSKNDTTLRSLPSSLEAPTTWWKVVRKVVSDGKVPVQVESLDADEGRALREWYDLQAYGGIVVGTGNPVESCSRGTLGY
ncbi:hypothetical protein M413DRAFT_22201 [Hebeloma cylindrosporum]|uniref:F-box domain-containing protein n=1 Tax=Hebeloma cylindrosporum TaxID=76867 RepID=A0A0C2Z2Q1_HEBCY|nr:hypothetical protein M413DRAFT_22201 [Hebeloma cylindrosporum h7]